MSRRSTNTIKIFDTLFRRIFKDKVCYGYSTHGWQSSYAADCKSADLGANPGLCSNRIILAYALLPFHIIMRTYVFYFKNIRYYFESTSCVHWDCFNSSIAPNTCIFFICLFLSRRNASRTSVIEEWTAWTSLGCCCIRRLV